MRYNPPRRYRRPVASLAERFWAKVEKSDGCWRWVGPRTKRGYGTIWDVEIHANTYAHRVSYEMVHGPIPADMQVCHRCDNPECVNPDHMFLGSASDNQLDAVSKRRRPIGTQVRFAKITPAVVIEIRHMHRDGESNAEIARRLNLSAGLIGAVVRRQTWKHVSEE